MSVNICIIQDDQRVYNASPQKCLFLFLCKNIMPLTICSITNSHCFPACLWIPRLFLTTRSGTTSLVHMRRIHLFYTKRNQEDQDESEIRAVKSARIPLKQLKTPTPTWHTKIVALKWLILFPFGQSCFSRTTPDWLMILAVFTFPPKVHFLF